VHNLGIVDVHNDATNEEGKGHVESEDLAGVRDPAVVRYLDTVVTGVDLHDRPAARSSEAGRGRPRSRR
jgi:hypothetical protein